MSEGDIFCVKVLQKLRKVIWQLRQHIVVRLESSVKFQLEQLHVNGGQPVVGKNERAEVYGVHPHYVKIVISFLVKKVVAEVQNSGVRRKGGERRQVPSRAVHPHCVAHVLSWSF